MMWKKKTGHEWPYGDSVVIFIRYINKESKKITIKSISYSLYLFNAFRRTSSRTNKFFPFVFHRTSSRTIY